MDWYWDGFVSPGRLTLLAGDPKVGKTTLLEGLLRAMARGEEFLGRETSPATAVVVSEDGARDFDGREALLGPAPGRELILGEFATTAEEWAGVIERAVDACGAGGHGVLVLDSFATLTGLDQGEAENDAASVGWRIRPLLVAARRVDLAVVFTHHLNRRGRTRGSTAFEGYPDVVTALHRREKQTAFDLRSRSRSAETPAHVRGNLDQGAPPWRYESLGEGAGGSSLAVWDALPLPIEEGATVEELVADSGVSYRTVKNCLLGYGAKDGGHAGWYPGRVERTGSGRAGDPFRYARKE